MIPIAEKSIGLGGTVFPERRAALRRRVLKGGKLVFNQGYSAMECVVRNLSDRGALLAFGDSSGVPARFDLAIFGEPSRCARVKWRMPTAVGVEFD